MVAPIRRAVIIYTGATGGLGRFMLPALERTGVPGRALSSRLENEDGLRRELEALPVGRAATLIHLAALVSVPRCEQEQDLAYRVNVLGANAAVSEFLHWAAARPVAARVLYVSTGHVYHPSDPPARLRESGLTAPRSVYARTKLEAEARLSRLCESRGVELCIARVFGLLSPGQPANYLLPGLVRRVRVGDVDRIPGLDCVRDYLDARDVCDDLVDLCGAARFGGVVNVCSGVATSIRALLGAVARAAGREPLAAASTAAPGRADDVAWLVGDPTLLEHRLGPRRRRPLEETIRDALAAH